ncbi:hypothetical protein Tco_1033054 [Tanacetum coccineum]|uniref:Uncharacterized protein n=1 Tax=Tanacetum coccineum TaxID=301880 RepID=A0ABQ5GDK4_9ASTR
MVVKTTDQILKDNLRRIVQGEILKEKASGKGESSSMVSQGIATTPPQQRLYQELSAKSGHHIKFDASSTSSESCRLNIFRKRDHDVHPDDDVFHEGETSVKKRKTSGVSNVL